MRERLCRVRERIKGKKIKPIWGGIFEAFAKKEVSKNLWKFQTLGYTYEDLLQETWLMFDYCKKRYFVFEDKHFMYLFKTAISQRFIDLSKKDSEEKEHRREPLLYLSIDDDNDYNKVIHGTVDNEGLLYTLIKRVLQDTELKLVMDVILNSPSEGLTNVNIAKLLKYDSNKKNLVKKLKETFNLEHLEDNSIK